METLKTAPSSGSLDQIGSSAEFLEVTEVPDDIADRLAEAHQTARTIMNADLNEAIGMQRQADAAKELAEMSTGAKDLLVLAQQLLEWQTSGSGEPSSEIADALASGITPSMLIEKASSMMQQREVAEESRKAKSSSRVALDSSRAAYTASLLSRKKLFGRKESNARIDEAEQAYNEAFTAYLESVVGLKDREQILRAGYVPEDILEANSENTTLERLSGEQLHVLVNELAREKLLKARDIEEGSGKLGKRVSKALGSNRALRIAIGSALWVGSSISEVADHLPPSLQVVGQVFDKVLPMAGMYMATKETMAGADAYVEGISGRRKLKQDVKEISSDTFLADSAMAMVYGRVEHEHIIGRSAVGDQEGDAELLSPSHVNEQLRTLENAPGGKPYKAEDILPYATQLLTEHREAVESILQTDNPQEAFMELSKMIIANDTGEFTSKVKQSKTKKVVFRGAALALTALAASGNGMLSDALGRAKELTQVGKQPAKYVPILG